MAIDSVAPEFGVFTPWDLDLLQSAYDEAIDTIAASDDATMADIAHVMLRAYEGGVRDRDQLVQIATRAFSSKAA